MISLKKQISAVLFLTAFIATLQVINTFNVARAIKMIEEFEPVVIERVKPTIEETTEPVPETTVEETEVKADEPENTVEKEPTEVSVVAENNAYLGTFKAYAYCACAKCCGKSDGITATGTKATQGRTIAVDPKVIPLGTEVYIEGYGNFIAEDTGSGIKGNTIDVFHVNHADALEWGVRQVKIYKTN